MTQLKKRLATIDPANKREEKYGMALIECVEKIREKEEVESVILYGSYSRGDYSTKHSDIDLMIFLSTEKGDAVEQEIKEIAADKSEKHAVKFTINFQYPYVDQEQAEHIKKIMEEGQVLYNNSVIIIQKEILGMRAFEMVVFDTKNASQLSRTKFSRLLHGFSSWYYKDDKKIVKEHEGIIDNKVVYSAGKGALLIRADKSERFKLVAEELGIDTRSGGLFYR